MRYSTWILKLSMKTKLSNQASMSRSGRSGQQITSSARYVSRSSPLKDAAVCALPLCHLRVYETANRFIRPSQFYSQREFVFSINAAVHLGVDEIFSLCFAAGVWRSGWND